MTKKTDNTFTVSDIINMLSTAEIQESPIFEEYGLKAIESTAQNRSKFSQKEDLQRFRTLCIFFGDMRLADIKPSTILEWQNNLSFAPKTIRNYRGTLNIVLNVAFADGYILSNPLTHTKPPKKIKKEVKVFSNDEIELLLSRTEGQFHNMLYFNFFEGLRGSELIALKWCDVDFSTKKININRRIRERDIDKPKGHKERTIDLMPQATEALLNQWEITSDNEYIFVTDKGTPYTKQDILTDRLRRLCKKLCISPRGMHTIRKTCNTLYRQHGLNSTWIMQQLGHESEEVNIAHYTGKVSIDNTEIDSFKNVLRGVK